MNLYNTTEAGKLLGCDQATVSRWLPRVGAEKAHGFWVITDEVIEKIREARAEAEQKRTPKPKPKAATKPKKKQPQSRARRVAQLRQAILNWENKQ